MIYSRYYETFSTESYIIVCIWNNKTQNQNISIQNIKKYIIHEKKTLW